MGSVLTGDQWERYDRLATQVRNDTARAYAWAQENRKEGLRRIMAKGATKEKPAPEPIEDERIDAFLAAVEPDERDSLKRCVKGKLGGLQTREGSRTWEKAEREVAVDLIRNNLALKDIEWGEG